MFSYDIKHTIVSIILARIWYTINALPKRLNYKSRLECAILKRLAMELVLHGKSRSFFKKFIKVLRNPEIFQEKCFGGVNVYSSWKPVTLLQMSFIKCVFPRISKRKNIADFIF